MNLIDLINSRSPVLTEGALVERLKSEFNLKMDPHVNHAACIYDPQERLAGLYRQYISIAREVNVPILIMTPTRRVNFESLAGSVWAENDLISDSCAFLKEIRSEFPDFQEKIFVGGLLGSRGDAFVPEGVPDEEEVFAFHQVQVNQFAKAQPDFLFASLLPSKPESVGMARAIAISGIPGFISFSVRKEGCLLDGCSIADAISAVDSAVFPAPPGYLASCIHPYNLRLAMSNPMNNNRPEMSRFIGIQANASRLSPEELNTCTSLCQESFDDMLQEISYLVHKHGFSVLGGCCGTDAVFLKKLSQQLAHYS